MAIRTHIKRQPDDIPAFRENITIIVKSKAIRVIGLISGMMFHVPYASLLIFTD